MDEVTIHGLKELQYALRQLPKELQGKVLTQALWDGGKSMIADAKARALKLNESQLPHHVGRGKELVQPGNISRNIMVRRVKHTDATATVSIGVRAKGKGSGNAFYWRFFEFGTKFISKKPFMRTAFEAKKLATADAIKLALGKRIEAAAAKLRVKAS
ncbi:MAG: HK97-gp10 family putative phage morphogenesis protein [Comamonadaceae bacterium]